MEYFNSSFSLCLLHLMSRHKRSELMLYGNGRWKTEFAPKPKRVHAPLLYQSAVTNPHLWFSRRRRIVAEMRGIRHFAGKAPQVMGHDRGPVLSSWILRSLRGLTLCQPVLTAIVGDVHRPVGDAASQLLPSLAHPEIDGIIEPRTVRIPL